MTADSCRHTDPATGVVAEVGTDGVPVGLALPEHLLERAPVDVASAVLRTLTAAAAGARDLLEQLAEQDWDTGQDWDSGDERDTGDEDAEETAETAGAAT